MRLELDVGSGCGWVGATVGVVEREERLFTPAEFMIPVPENPESATVFLELQASRYY